MVELQPSKLNVASSSLVSRSRSLDLHSCKHKVCRDVVWAHVAQSVERFLGKEEVHQFDSGHGLHNSECDDLATKKKKLSTSVEL